SVGLTDRMDHRPRELSGGQQQRVAIARALITQPALLLADEPTGNLDARRSRDVLALMRELCSERRIPVLLVTHDHEALDHVDRVCTLRDGTLSDGLDAEVARAASR
ncbi:MAG TPA: ATP-binding cassette domain-containing protein, partial [Conexibacter sp.]|nr:ATP-binding cassette domain-containing protein [Conexibacter sp.]